MPQTRVPVLPSDEWGRLRAVGPFLQAGVLPDPVHATVLVEEEPAAADGTPGAIVGCWMVTSIMLLEGLWRREDYRQTYSAKRLLFGMIEWLRDRRVKSAITVIQDPTVRTLAEKVGFVALPGGTLHVLTVAPTDDEEGE